MPAGKVAEHCNEKRLSARNAQDASLQLYLCVLLRRSPMVTQAVVTGVGGNLYFSVYVPELGVEARYVADYDS
jgi:DIS3-like exonuclease 2